MKRILFLVLLLGLALPGWAQKTLYFTPNAIGTNIWSLDETAPTGSSNTTTIASNAASTTGWYHLDPGLTDSSADAGEPTNTTPGWNTVWVSSGGYYGTFATGAWTFTIRKTDSRSNRVGYFHVDIYKSSSQTNQASATLIGHCSDGADDWTGAAATVTVTCASMPQTTFNGDYIVLRTLNQVATGSTSSGTWTLIVSDVTNGLSRFTTPAFTSSARRRITIQ